MPNCFMEVVYQNRWYRICAVATATCFLSEGVISSTVSGCLGWGVLFQQYACFMDELATKCPQIFFQA